MSNDASEGGCRCGEVRFRVSGRPLVTMACHCRGCQRMTASAFSLSALYLDASLEILQGEPVIGGLRGETRHYFCPNCMSWLFSRLDGLDHLVNVRAVMLDDVDPAPPLVETQTAEKLPWAVTGATHSYERFPPMGDFEDLIAQYAAL